MSEEQRVNPPGVGTGPAATQLNGVEPRFLGVENLYQLLVESVRDYAIFALDSTGHIVSWNAGAERIKGYTAEEIIGRHLSVFYPQEDRDAHKVEWELEVAARDGRVEDEGWRLRKDGSRFWASVVLTALHGPDGKLVGFAKVTRDLTERRAAQERALADAMKFAELEAANRAKSGFLTSLSHELRTPLNAIGGYVDLLLLGVRGPLTQQQVEDLRKVRRSQQHLLSVINDLLNFSKLEAGAVSYDIRDVRVAEAVGAVHDMVAQQAQSRNVRLVVRPCPDGLTAHADASKLEQILINLLGNAVKFTPPEGSITVTCEHRGGSVAIVVSDTGLGIPADQQESIFEPFVQLGRSLTHTHEGTGLGLSISRDLARAMQGDITVTSTPGKGATFTLLLPA